MSVSVTNALGNRAAVSLQCETAWPPRAQFIFFDQVYRTEEIRFDSIEITGIRARIVFISNGQLVPLGGNAIETSYPLLRPPSPLFSAPARLDLFEAQLAAGDEEHRELSSAFVEALQEADYLYVEVMNSLETNDALVSRRFLWSLEDAASEIRRLATICSPQEAGPVEPTQAVSFDGNFTGPSPEDLSTTDYQTYLVSMGFSSIGNIDGVIGQRTQAALTAVAEQFEQAFGLSVSGEMAASEVGSIPTKVRNPPQDFAMLGGYRNVQRVAV